MNIGALNANAALHADARLNTNAAPGTNGIPAELTSPATAPGDADQRRLREVFDSFVGETFYGQMFEAMRKTVDKPAYFHGGQAEEIFRGQLDQMLAERMSKTQNGGLTDAMFELFTLRRG